MIPRRHRVALPLLLAAALAFATTLSPAVSHAAPKPWNGRYQMVTYASPEGGYEPSGPPEGKRFRRGLHPGHHLLGEPLRGDRGRRSAPRKSTVPWPTRYTWNGSEWTTSYDWLWDCFLGNGNQKQWARATSWAYYQPQPDGSLRGTWHRHRRGCLPGKCGHAGGGDTGLIRTREPGLKTRLEKFFLDPVTLLDLCYR